MKVLGLSGGIATGKSFVSSFWKEQGVIVVDCDHIARAVVQKVSTAETHLVALQLEAIL